MNTIKFWINKTHGIQDVFGELVVIPTFTGDFTGSSPCDSGSFVECDALVDGGVMSLARNEAFDGGNGKMLRYFAGETIAASQVMLLGLGDKDKVSNDSLQDALAKMFKKVKALKLGEVTVDMRPLLDNWFDAEPLGHMVASLACFLDHNGLTYKTKRGGYDGATNLNTLRVLVPEDAHGDFKAGMYAGRELANGMNLTRDLVDTPGCNLRPTAMAEAAQKVVDESNGTIVGRYIYPDTLEKMGAELLLGVARGSGEPAILIDLEYTPPTGPTEEVLCLIGKTVTFDSGGLNLKSGAGMATMKRDMAGGATVLGALKAIAALEIPVSVRVIMAAAENMTGENATRPGDVHTSMSGLTVEIGNTDAEGRLTLGDAVEYAKRKNVSAIVDFATLTGAAISIGGDVASPCFTNNDRFGARFAEIANSHGDNVIPIPMFEEIRKLNRSEIADVKNTGGAMAGSTTAAWFIREFVGEEMPWVHVDIAGTAYRSRSIGFCPKGASAYGVRTAVALAYEFANDPSIIK